MCNLRQAKFDVPSGSPMSMDLDDRSTAQVVVERLG